MRLGSTTRRDPERDQRFNTGFARGVAEGAWQRANPIFNPSTLADHPGGSARLDVGRVIGTQASVARSGAGWRCASARRDVRSRPLPAGVVLRCRRPSRPSSAASLHRVALRAPVGRNPRVLPPPRPPRVPLGRNPRVLPPPRSPRASRPLPARSLPAPLSASRSAASRSFFFGAPLGGPRRSRRARRSIARQRVPNVRRHPAPQISQTNAPHR
jgi:hypothetical protein